MRGFLFSPSSQAPSNPGHPCEPPFLFAILLCLLPAAAGVRLHEAVSSNGSVNADEDGAFEDWVELHNPGDEPVDLTGWGLSDSAATPFRWVFPDRVLAPGAFLLVWTSGKDRAPAGAGPLHANFRLCADGETVLLTRSDTTRADEVTFPPLPRDTSYGRLPVDGIWRFFLTPTPLAENSATVVLDAVDREGQPLFVRLRLLWLPWAFLGVVCFDARWRGREARHRKVGQGTGADAAGTGDARLAFVP
jgi:hypothetical protein